MIKHLKYLSWMLFLIFLFRSTPEQYFIYLHPHEHHHHCTHHELAVEEVYHDCSDHFEYLKFQEYNEAIEHQHQLQEIGTHYFFRPVLGAEQEIIQKNGRSPPLIT